MWLPFLERFLGRWHITYHLYLGETPHVSLSLLCWPHDLVDPGFLGNPTQCNHTYISPEYNWMVPLKYLSFVLLQILNLLPPISKTYIPPIIPLLSHCIVLPHLLLFLTLYKNKKGIQSTPSEVMLEPRVLLACMASVVRRNKNTILPLLYNLASKNHPWYPIFLENLCTV